MRAIFFDESEATEVVARLVRDGFAAELERERFAGEDDDEDHPWAVTSDAPAWMLELLTEQYDGWLDAEGGEAPRSGAPGAGAVPPPLDLPTAPRRVTRLEP